MCRLWSYPQMRGLTGFGRRATSGGGRMCRAFRAAEKVHLWQCKRRPGAKEGAEKSLHGEKAYLSG
jgi:hypothetical protein